VGAWRPASLVLYAIVVLLAIVTFVIPALIGVCARENKPPRFTPAEHELLPLFRVAS
jgi:type II secretory pathway component PulF